MPLPQEEFANPDDSPLFQRIKTQNWPAAASLLLTADDDDDDDGSARAAARETDRYGNTVLHSAIGFQAPEALLLRLLELHPDATRVHGTDDWLPLHVAAMWGYTSARVMESMIRLHPQALDDKGAPGIKGRTPRHFAARFAEDDERRQMLERSTADWVARIEKEGKEKATT